MKRTIPVEVQAVTQIHDKCGGEYFPSGEMLLTDPPKFPHVCNKCGNVQNFNEKSPTIEYIRQQEGE